MEIGSSNLSLECGALRWRILTGTKPIDLPVVQSVKFEPVINMKTANTLGVAIYLALLGRALEVIEWGFGVAMHEFVCGTSRTSRGRSTMSVYGGKAVPRRCGRLLLKMDP